jgi:glycosyltransferase involved in cell wall biosynthesis
MTAPRIPDVGVIGLVPDFWSGVWQPRHYVLSRLPQFFPTVWFGHMHDRGTLWTGAAQRETRVSGRDGFSVYRQPPWLPKLYRPAWLADWTARARLEGARRMLRRMGAKRIVLYVWRPDLGYALDLLEHDLCVYHIDDEYTFSPVEQPVDSSEAHLIDRADQVIVHSPALAEKKGDRNPHTAQISNGVDYHAYATPLAEPADLAAIPHPRVGYIGRIKPQLDLDLLLTLSARHPEWSFVMVGPIVSFPPTETRIATLRARANVHFLGGKTVEEMPAYNQHFDVSIMCYALTDYTKFIYPMKLHEYLATGQPVVASPIRSLQDFAEVVALAASADEWSDALREALAPAANTQERRASRQAVARQHDWDALTRRVAGLICERLGEPYAAQFEAIADAPSESVGCTG